MKYVNMLKAISELCKSRDICAKCPLHVYDSKISDTRCALDGVDLEKLLEDVDILNNK